MNRFLANAAVAAGAIAMSAIAAFVMVGEDGGDVSDMQPSAETRVPSADFAAFAQAGKPAEHHANRATNPRGEKSKPTERNEEQRAYGIAEKFAPRSDETKDAERGGAATRLMLSTERRNTFSPAYLSAVRQSAKSAGKKYLEKTATQQAPESIADTRKTPNNGTPENSQDAPAKPQKDGEASSSKSTESEVAARPPSSDNFSTINPPPPRKKREWPKPFTPEEERYRQQIGVQAFINFQHELATGQGRQSAISNQ